MSLQTDKLLKHRTHREGMSSLARPAVWLTGAATIFTIISVLVFSIFYQKGLAGFGKQLNAFVSIGELSNLFLQTTVVIIAVLFIFYLFISFLASARFFRGPLSCLGSPCTLFLSSFSAHAFLIIWVILLCVVFSTTIVYLIFISSIYSFCAIIDNQCFDFKVLIPAVVSKISNKKVDMTFCAEKKELLCSSQNNQTSSFIVAFLAAFIAFGGGLFVQNCVVYGLGRRQADKVNRRHEEYELRHIEKAQK